MPSGSHGGSSGSHSSGGGSHGGGFSFGSHSSSYRHSSRPMTFNVFGRHYYIPIGSSISRIISLILPCLVFSFFIFMFFLSIIINSNQTIKKIDIDYQYYNNMIRSAESNPELQITGKVKDIFLNEKCEKWYITYTFGGMEQNLYEGYSFPVYTLNEVSKFKIGDNIQLAVNSFIINSNTDSIPMDYKNIPLEQDGEYIKAIHKKQLFTNILIGLGCVFLLLIILLIFKIVKSSKRNEYEKELKTVANTNIPLEQAQETKRCKYCGSRLNSDEIECKNCGAKLD